LNKPTQPTVLNQNEPDRAIKLYQVRWFFSKKPKSEVLLDFNANIEEGLRISKEK